MSLQQWSIVAVLQRKKQNEPFLEITRESLKMEELNMSDYLHKGLLQESTKTNGDKVSICKVQYALAGKSSSVSYFHI